jgi:hypothetical protein
MRPVLHSTKLHRLTNTINKKFVLVTLFAAAVSALDARAPAPAPAPAPPPSTDGAYGPPTPPRACLTTVNAAALSAQNYDPRIYNIQDCMRDIPIGGSCRITCINNQRHISAMAAWVAAAQASSASAGYLCLMPIAPKPVKKL